MKQAMTVSKRLLVYLAVAGIFLVLLVLLFNRPQWAAALADWASASFWWMTACRWALWAGLWLAWPRIATWAEPNLETRRYQTLLAWRWRILRVVVVYELLFPFNVIGWLVTL